MKYYFAPLEGISLAPLRREHSREFPGIDKYFSPFLVANQTLHFHKSEIRDILPENNQGLYLVPQILTNKAGQLLWALRTLAGYGYNEINLNLGCPMPQVAKRGRGAGFLADPDELDRFFETVFEGMAEQDMHLQLSVKTRIGISDIDEAVQLMRIYNRYPLSELIIHPRLMNEMYKGSPHMDIFEAMSAESSHPVCYNGDLRTPADVSAFRNRYAGTDRVMIGRGLIADPSLVAKIKGIRTAPEAFVHYHDRLFEDYLALYPDNRQAVSKMKDIWSFRPLCQPVNEKLFKKMRKAVTPDQYLTYAHMLLSEAEGPVNSSFSCEAP
ncbi:MAG: tRNA-dihydrouridine synthase family protein [Blautia sp.]|nr:tRNA-dihydrouridine synthase family protein [Blautia sp.]